jgi:hypothetical protein
MGAAKDGVTHLYAVPDDHAFAMAAARRKRVDRALQSVKGHLLTTFDDLKGFIVIVSAYIAAHGRLLQGGQPPAV